ncbi:MAG: CRTAC1 family protein [Acidobacteriota bacterium]|nr:CRTAC1 family protein [Acidobacteriota bacterium]
MRLLLIFTGCLLMLYGASEAVHYVDIAQSAGLTVPNVYGGVDKKDFIIESTGNGVAIFDFDRDGHNDIFIASGTTVDRKKDPPPQLYRNDGHGHFTDVSNQAGFKGEGWAQGVCAGDYDNDGNTDLFVTYYGHNRLYRNTGKGQFEDVTAQVKLPVTGTRYGSGCSFFDYDRDGRLDLIVSNYVELDLARAPKPGQADQCIWKGLAVLCGPHGLPLTSNTLFHSNVDGTFTDVSEKAGILAPGGRYGLSIATADFDNDGWPDIYIACDQTPSLLFHNKHDGTFEEQGAAAGVAYNFEGRLQAGMGVAVADYDGNGFLDIAKTNFSGDLTSLYNNEDGKFFSDVSMQAGLAARQFLGWGVAFIDSDEDGWKDLVIANGHIYPEVDHSPVGDQYLQPTLFYRNLGSGRFQDLTSEAGPAFRALRPARGLAVGDVDGDGRQEIVIVNMNRQPSLLKNTGSRQHSLVVEVAGTKSNRSGIGARISVDAGKRRRIDEIMSGGSYYSQNELAAYFGLGPIKEVDRIEIRWPSGLVQLWPNPGVNRRVRAVEGEKELRVLKTW